MTTTALAATYGTAAYVAVLMMLFSLLCISRWHNIADWQHDPLKRLAPRPLATILTDAQVPKKQLFSCHYCCRAHTLGKYTRGEMEGRAAQQPNATS